MRVIFNIAFLQSILAWSKQCKFQLRVILLDLTTFPGKQLRGRHIPEGDANKFHLIEKCY